MDNDTIRAEFYNVCGAILMGEASEEELTASIKAMCDSGQQKTILEEFTKIGRTLTGEKAK